jgi:hypothetical protein
MKGLPKTVTAVLQDYIGLLHDVLPDTIEGLYLHGSVALNAFVEDSSDIDFITIISRRLEHDELEILSTIHERISKKYKKPEMDGVYLLWEDVGLLYNQDQSDVTEFPYYNNNKLLIGPYFNFNPITWILLKQRGINIIGPNPSLLDLEISPIQLKTFVLDNMNTYWAERVRLVEQSVEKLLNLSQEELDIEIEWTVLGLLRQFYTLKENGIISKLESGEYGLRHIPKEWHEIIREATNIRMGAKEKLFGSKKASIDSLVGLAIYIINYCNNNSSLLTN